MDGTTYFFYDRNEVIEERDGSGGLLQQYIYGTTHIDELVMVRGTHGTFFVYQDPNWNVMALTTPGRNGATGETPELAPIVAEESRYTPYGRVVARRHSAFGDQDSDGDMDTTDLAAWNATQNGGVYDRMLDADLDGDNDSFDQTAFNDNFYAPGESVEVSGRFFSPNGLDYGYTGRRLDPETGLMHYRARSYSPTLKNFGQRDPVRYVDSADLYQYVPGDPLNSADPFGETCGASDIGAYEVSVKRTDGTVCESDRQYLTMIPMHITRFAHGCEVHGVGVSNDGEIKGHGFDVFGGCSGVE